MTSTGKWAAFLLLAAAAGAQEAERPWWVVLSRKGEAYLQRSDGKQALKDTRLPVRPGARLSPDGKWWLFAEWRNKNRDLFVCLLDGSREQRLTTHAAMDSAADWAPDGKRIVFNSERDGSRQVWLREPNREPVQLTWHPNGAWGPRFSPTGNRIAFLSRHPRGRGKGWQADVVVMDLDTRETVTLARRAWMPHHAWSPDGKRLAVGDPGQLRVFDVETRGVVTHLKLKETDKRLFAHSPSSIVWRPDGKELACAITFIGSRRAVVPRSATGGFGKPKFEPLYGDRELFLVAAGKLRAIKLPEGVSPRPLRWIR